MIVGNETAGAGGTGPTPAQISTGGANATGNTGTTQVTQSIVLTGNDVASQLAAVLNLGVGVSNSGLNFALAAVTGNNTGSPSSVTFVTHGRRRVDRHRWRERAREPVDERGVPGRDGECVRQRQSARRPASHHREFRVGPGEQWTERGGRRRAQRHPARTRRRRRLRRNSSC